MDKIDIKDMLEKAVGDKFDFHPEFYEDFAELVEKSGQEEKVANVFIRKLLAIIELGDIDCGINWLEKLKEYDNMYSLRVNTNNHNYRLLFSKQSNKKYFLHMFFEKSGKGATSYDKHVPIAIQRRNDK